MILNNILHFILSENNIDIQDVKETTEKPFEQSADWYDY